MSQALEERMHFSAGVLLLRTVSQTIVVQGTLERLQFV